MSAQPRPREMGRVKKTLGLSALGALLAAKLWMFKKWRGLTHGGESETGPIDRRQFARLPRKRQLSVLYDRRASLRDLENIAYGSGYSPRRRRSSTARRGLLW